MTASSVTTRLCFVLHSPLMECWLVHWGGFWITVASARVIAVMGAKIYRITTFPKIQAQSNFFVSERRRGDTMLPLHAYAMLFDFSVVLNVGVLPDIRSTALDCGMQSRIRVQQAF